MAEDRYLRSIWVDKLPAEVRADLDELVEDERQAGKKIYNRRRVTDWLATKGINVPDSTVAMYMRQSR
jgi:hypothetical protein